MTEPGRPIVLLRTHRSFDARTRNFVERLQREGPYELVIAADERHGVVDSEGIDKVSLTKASIEALGIRPHPQMGWLCGDYCLYLARQALPGTPLFWMLEPDVRLNYDHLADFFCSIDRDRETDFVAIGLQEARSPWHWTARMAPHRQPVFRCLFPLVRLSNAAVVHLEAARRGLPASLPASQWPNDESFVASVLMNDGFKCKDLAEFGRHYTSATFGFQPRISGSAFDTTPVDGKVYHPVLYGSDLLRKAIQSRGRWRHPASRRHLAELVAQECGPGGVSEFNAAIAERGRRTTP